MSALPAPRPVPQQPSVQPVTDRIRMCPMTRRQVRQAARRTAVALAVTCDCLDDDPCTLCRSMGRKADL